MDCRLLLFRIVFVVLPSVPLAKDMSVERRAASGPRMLPTRIDAA